MELRLSVIITNYNYGRFLRDAIESALAIRWQNKEVLVVDDGSTDNSREIIAEFGDRIVPLLKKNGGQASAANVGFAASTGDVIMFLDADDLVVPTIMKVAAPLFSEKVAKIQWPLTNIDAKGLPTGGMFPNFPDNFTPDFVRQEMSRTGFYLCSPTSGNLYARRVLEHVFPIPEGVTVGLDSFTNITVPLYGDVITLPDSMGCYRVHGNNQWAMGKLQPERFIVYVEDDLVRTKFMLEKAAEVGFNVIPDPLRNQVTHLAFRIVTTRALPPEKQPIPGDNAFRVLRHAIPATIGMRGASLFGRACLLAWFCGVAMLPQSGALYLAKLRFMSHTRPKIVKKLMEIARFRRANSGSMPSGVL